MVNVETDIGANMDIIDSALDAKADDGHTHVGLAPGVHTHSDFTDHAADTTGVHGIADTSALATATAVGTAIEAHRTDTTDVHGIADTSALATATSVSSSIATHSADTTDVHGITNTALLLTSATHALIDHDDIPGSTSIPVQASAPASPDLHDLWVDEDEPAITEGGGGTEIPYQADAPASPAEGDLWVDSDATPSGSTVGVLGYAEVTATQTGIGTSDTDLTGLSVTVTVAASRRIKITAKGNLSQQTSAGTNFLMIKEGATILNESYETSLAGYDWGAVTFAIVTPSAGSHTYKVAAKTTAATTRLDAGTVFAAFILVEDIGPA